MTLMPYFYQIIELINIYNFKERGEINIEVFSPIKLVFFFHFVYNMRS